MVPCNTWQAQAPFEGLEALKDYFEPRGPAEQVRVPADIACGDHQGQELGLKATKLTWAWSHQQGKPIRMAQLQI